LTYKEYHYVALHPIAPCSAGRPGATLLPAAFAQPQDTQSVAEAARHSRGQKKNSVKPVKVITEETLDVKKGDVQSATAEQLRIPGTPETPAQPAAGAANANRARLQESFRRR